MKTLRRMSVLILALIMIMGVLSIQVFAADAWELDGDYVDDAETITVESYVTKALENKDTWVQRYLKYEKDGSASEYVFYCAANDSYYSAKGSYTQDDLITAAKKHYASDKATTKTGQMTSDLGVEADTENAMEALRGFVPVVNIILGILTVLITLLLAVFTAFDVCYITFPVFRNKCEEQKQSGQGPMVKKTSNGGTKLRWVSDEAQYVVEQNSVESGKSPLTAYLGKRIVSYIAVAVILFILLTGNITVITNLALKIVSYIIDIVDSLG